MKLPLKGSKLALGIVVGLSLATGAARAQIGSGWTSMSIGGFIDYEVDGAHHQHSISSFSLSSMYYTKGTSSETFGLKTSHSNRVEHDTDSHYQSGRRQFQGNLQIFSGISSQSCVQIFNAPASGPILMIKGYGSDNGTLKKQGGSVVIATSCFGTTKRVNLVHDLNANTMAVYINGTKKWSGSGGAGGSFNLKYGLYGSFNSATKTIWSSVRMWH